MFFHDSNVNEPLQYSLIVVRGLEMMMRDELRRNFRNGHVQSLKKLNSFCKIGPGFVTSY